MWERFVRILPVATLSASLLASPVLVSCGGDDGSSAPAPSKEGKVGSTSFLLLSESGLSLPGTTLEGSGSAIAKAPLGEVKAAKSLAVTFSVADGGSLSIRAFADRALAGGVSLTLSRKGKALAATLDASGESVDASKSFGALDASGDVSILLDVHNDETPAHVLAWKGGMASPSDANSLFNSEKAGDGESPGNGKGTFWGLVLSKAVVKAASSAEAKFEHE